jgi:hypothetical protein
MNWTTGSSSKKNKIDIKKESLSKKETKETFSCLECLEKCCSTNKLDEIKCTIICRNDKSSVDKHKARRHQSPSNMMCTIVPTHSTRVKLIKEKYQGNDFVNTKSIKESTALSNPAAVNITQPSQQSRGPLQATLLDYAAKERLS